jgi:hypothetical protein
MTCRHICRRHCFQRGLRLHRDTVSASSGRAMEYFRFRSGGSHAGVATRATDRARGVYMLKKHSDPIVARTSSLALRAIRYQLLDDFAIRATGVDASAIVQRQNVVAVGSRFDVADVANIDDIRTVDAQEHVRIEEFKQGLNGRVGEMVAACGMQLHIVLRSLNPTHILQIHESRLAGGAHGHARESSGRRSEGLQQRYDALAIVAALLST